MKKKRENWNSPLVVIVTALLFIIIVYLIIKSNTRQNVYYQSPSYVPTQATQERIFRSKNLKFSIKVPNNFRIKASNTGVDLIVPEGWIEIVRNGTQFLSLSEYLDDFDNRRDIKIKTTENINIARYITTRREEERLIGGVIKNPKAYYIWMDGIVYILSTTSSFLFGDLDQIAQSFRYTP